MPATVIVGAQWGDEGKGKIVDLLAQSSEFVCRYQGGPNAGHTIVSGGETFKLHHVPSGILYEGKISVIGAGCVVDPQLLVEEIDALEARGVSTEGLRLSGNAHLIMPWHVALDSASASRTSSTRRSCGRSSRPRSRRRTASSKSRSWRATSPTGWRSAPRGYGRMSPTPHSWSSGP